MLLFILLDVVHLVIGEDIVEEDNENNGDTLPQVMVETGDLVCLSNNENTVFVRASGERKNIGGLGVFSPERLVGMCYGDRLSFGPRTFLIRFPTLSLLHQVFRRKAQVIMLKDAYEIVGELGITNGSRLLEIGVGSGFMTSVLLWFCGGKGSVVSYEIRPDFARVARKNICMAGLERNWDLRVADAREVFDVSERGRGARPRLTDVFDGIVVDIPDPWSVLPGITSVLVRGGQIAFYIPTFNQLERTIDEMKTSGFHSICAREIWCRNMKTSPGKIRPESAMVAHTGFLLFGFAP